MKTISLIISVLFCVNTISQQAVNKDLTGDYYDNRDGNHANMSLSPHPGLTYMSSGYGIQNLVISNLIVFGNASLAYTSGNYWGSLTRVINMRSQTGMTSAYDLYINNNAYWYPEHNDHDAVDYYFTQAPMINNSQGSSGSEIDEMHKWFYALDVFDASTKSFLTTQNLLIPTMQFIARRSRVSSDNEYLSGIAHPNAFNNADVRTEMETMASNINAATIPPMVQIDVVDNQYDLIQGVDNFWFFEPIIYPIKKENIHETPVSISHIWHGLEYTKRIVVSAQNSYDANGLPLTYHWSILRGDSSQITINPLNANESEVEILINYHSETTIPNSSRYTNLVSIGVFVHNGHYYSAPAFVTSYTKRNELRTYNTTTNKIESIVYNNNYLDPTVSYEKDWDSDYFLYDINNELIGWTRLKGSQIDRFTKEGYVVESEDAQGNPISVSEVRYSLNINLITIWERHGSPFTYTLGVNDLSVISKISLFPNPTSDNISIHIKNNYQKDVFPLNIKIFNVNGKLLNNTISGNKITVIDTKGFASGKYIVKVIFKNNKKQELFFIKK